MARDTGEDTADASASIGALIAELNRTTRLKDAEAVTAELATFGDEALRALKREVEYLSAPAQLAAVQVAELLGGEAAVALLEQILNFGNCAAERPALRALGRCSGEAALAVLLEWLDETLEPAHLEVMLESIALNMISLEVGRTSAILAEMNDEKLEELREIFDREVPAELDGLVAAVRRESDGRRLQRFGTVLKPSEDESERAHHRGRVIQAMEDRLTQSGNRSFLLVGPAGVGKSVILRELCHRLGPESPADTILQTSTGLLMAGTRYLGEWQTRVNELVELVRSNRRVIVNITDINHLIGAGAHESSRENIADFFAPYMQRGDLTLIGESTAEELRRGLDQRPDFKRLFHIIQVPEPLQAETEAIVHEVSRAVARGVQERIGRPIIYNRNFFARLLEVSDQFRSQVARPGRAVDLLKQTVDRVLRIVDPGDLEEIVLEPHHIIDALVGSTGVPRALLDDRDPLDLEALRGFFNERVLGQEAATEAVVDLITLIKAGLTDPTKPTGVLFFVGPTGVGKTELAKSLAEYIFGSQDRMLRLDMSEFMDPGSAERLIGSPHAPESSPHRQGLLTGHIRQEPFTVVLLDEFEKAHRSVYDLFLQVMDDGRLTDASGRVAHFTPAILIMTSNVGSTDLFQRGLGFNPRSKHDERDLEGNIRREMERVFRPEFVNRIDRIVPFRPLERDDIRRIVRREVGKVLERSGIKRRNITPDPDPSLIDLLADKGFDPRYGARPLKREVERRLLLPLGRKIVELGPRAERALLRLVADGDQVRVEVIRSIEHDSPAAHREPPEDESPETRDERRIREALTVLQERVGALEEHSATEGLEERKTLLVHASSQPSFWDTPARARQVLSQIHWIGRLLRGLERVRKRTDDLGYFLDSSGRRADETLANARKRQQDISSEVGLLEMAILCSGEEARSDTFITVERLDDNPLEIDPVRTLLEMYIAWGGALPGFAVDVIDEKIDGEQLRAGTILVQGFCPYGILSVEDGVHRFVLRDESRRSNRVTAFCRVDVRAFIDDQNPHIGKRELSVKAERRRGRGLLIKRHKSRVHITHKPSDLRVSTTSDKAPDDATNMATEYLRALLAHRRPASEDATGLPVRTYNLGLHPGVRDEQTEVRAARPEEVFEGQIEPFLKARLEARHPHRDDATPTVTRAR